MQLDQVRTASTGGTDDTDAVKPPDTQLPFLFHVRRKMCRNKADLIVCRFHIVFLFQHIRKAYGNVEDHRIANTNFTDQIILIRYFLMQPVDQ